MISRLRFTVLPTTLLCAALAISCGGSTDVTGAGGAGGQGGGQGGSGGATCGGEICEDVERCYLTCQGERACSYPNITCGEHDMGACGCDGNAYETLCALDGAAVQQGVAGSCEPPAGTFACEGLLCRLSDQICVIGPGSSYCHFRDSACNDCGCIDPMIFCQGAASCTDTAGITLTCD